MSATVFFDHEENSANPALKGSGVKIFVDAGIILNRDRISLKCKVSDHLGNISLEPNAELRNSFPLRISYETVKPPRIDRSIEIVNIKSIADFTATVRCQAASRIDLLENFRAAIFQLFKRAEISGRGNCGSGHFSDEGNFERASGGDSSPDLQPY